MIKFFFKTFLFCISTQFIFACASFFHDEDSSSPKSSASVPPIKIVESQQLKKEMPPVITSPAVQAAHDEVEYQLSLRKKESSPILNDHDPSQEAPEFIPKTPITALRWLKNGNTRFYRNRLRADGQSLVDVKRISKKGQRPHTIILACSDSAVPPEIIFDQKLGEIFVIRTAGESLDAIGVGTIEYALTRFKTRHILILGHTKCGSILGACSELEGGPTSTENAHAIVKDISSRLAEFKGKTFSANLGDEAWANVKGIADELPKRSSVISMMMKKNGVQISTAIYDVDTGKVEFK